MNAVSLIDFDRKLVVKMHDVLKMYEERRIDLGQLINDLEGLFREMTSKSALWKGKFFEKWVELECSYAAILHTESKEVNQDDMRTIKDVIDAIHELVASVIDAYPKFLDNTVKAFAVILDDHWINCPFCQDAWQSATQDPMIICPNCGESLINPHNKK